MVWWARGAVLWQRGCAGQVAPVVCAVVRVTRGPYTTVVYKGVSGARKCGKLSAFSPLRVFDVF